MFPTCFDPRGFILREAVVSAVMLCFTRIGVSSLVDEMQVEGCA